MVSVPYTPVPGVLPSNIATPDQHVNAPIEAFGGATAAATVGFGQQLEKSGDEIFQRAQALQALNNESEAREADAKYMVAVGEEHAKYSALEGKSAVDGYPAYAQKLQDLRTQMRDNLSNDYARKLFDGSSLSTMGRTIFNGAGHAGTENKKYAEGSIDARIGAAGDQALSQPRDDVGFQSAINSTKAMIQQKGNLGGWSSERTDQATSDAVGALWAKRIIGLSRSEPQAAAKMLEEHQDELGKHYFQVENSVRQQSRAVSSVNIANEVYAGGKGTDDEPGKSLADMEADAKAKAEALDPKDPILAQHAVAALRGLYNQDKYASRQEEITNTQTVAGAIQKGVRDVQELRTDPKIAAAIDALPKDKQNAIPGQINRYNAAVNKTTNADNYQRLWGMSNNDVEGFLNTDLTSEQLSQGDMRKLQEQQRKLKDQPNADPRVSRAIDQVRSAMGAQLEALSIYRRTDGNKDDYDRFTGAMQSALDVWQEQNKKPATYKDITETIGPQVIRTVSEPGWLYGANKVPFFKQSVPKEFSEAAKEHAIGEGRPEPTEAQVQHDFMRMKFMQLYSKPKSDGK